MAIINAAIVYLNQELGKLIVAIATKWGPVLTDVPSLGPQPLFRDAAATVCIPGRPASTTATDTRLITGFLKQDFGGLQIPRSR